MNHDFCHFFVSGIGYSGQEPFFGQNVILSFHGKPIWRRLYSICRGLYEFRSTGWWREIRLSFYRSVFRVLWENGWRAWNRIECFGLGSSFCKLVRAVFLWGSVPPLSSREFEQISPTRKLSRKLGESLGEGEGEGRVGGAFSDGLASHPGGSSNFLGRKSRV